MERSSGKLLSRRRRSVSRSVSAVIAGGPPCADRGGRAGLGEAAPVPPAAL